MVANGVEVFEVGIEQLERFENLQIGRSDLILVGDYVVVEFSTMYGESRGYASVQLTAVYSSLLNATNALTMLYREDLRLMNVYDLKHGYDYEVWKVVDDADLWQVWDHDVEQTKLMQRPKAWVYGAVDCSEGEYAPVEIRDGMEPVAHTTMYGDVKVLFGTDSDGDGCWFTDFAVVNWLEDYASVGSCSPQVARVAESLDLTAL